MLYFGTDKVSSLNLSNMHHSQLEKGVDGLFDSFARLDSRISSVGQTAAKIGDHLQVIRFVLTTPRFYWIIDS